MKKYPFVPASFGLAGLLVVLLLGAGCHGSSDQRDLLTEELTAGERPVSMKGEKSFLDGQLIASATVSRGFDRGPKAGSVGRRGKGGDRDTKFATDEYSGSSGGDSDEAQQEAMEDYMRLVRAQRAAGSPMPPVTLRVQFENHGQAPMEVAVTEVNSELGNFAVRPEKLTIAPGATGTLEPMISQLGVTSDEIPVKVTVRTAGKKETQTVLVKSILAPTPAKK